MHRPNSPPPTRSQLPPLYPEESVTFLRHPCQAPARRMPRARSVPSPRLRNFFPRFRPDPAILPPLLNKPYIRAIVVHGRGGFQTRPGGPTAPPGNPAPKRDWCSGIRSGVPCGRLVAAKTPPVDPSAPCPLLLCGATLLRQHAHSGTTELRRTAGALSYGSHVLARKLTDFTVPTPRGNGGTLDEPGKPTHFLPRFGALRAVCRRLKMPSKKSICQRSEGDSK